MLFRHSIASVACVSILYWLALPINAGGVDQTPTSIGCGSATAKHSADAMPIGEGPLRLSAIHCLPLPGSSVPVSPPSPSPDGMRFFAYDSLDGLWIGEVGSVAKPRHSQGRLSVAGLGFSETIPFAWSSDSNGLFGARQETQKPSGFALEPLTLTSILPNGMSRALPMLQHPAGGLDGIVWVGGNGLAVAEFGTKGGYYKPEHADPEPTLAFIDAKRGLVLQAIKLSSLSSTPILDIDAQLDKFGKIQSVFVLAPNQWIEWKQDRAPETLPLKVNSGRHPFTLTPDGKNALLMHNLSATGVICEHNPNCPKPTPQIGIIAELRDIATGTVLWSITGKATNFSRSFKPAVSPDGRYGLIPLPPNGNSRESIALISMGDGRIIQRVDNAWGQMQAVGFSLDSKSLWASGRSLLVSYELRTES
jgi:hypothetical protein